MYDEQVHRITPNHVKCYKVKVTLFMFYWTGVTESQIKVSSLPAVFVLIAILRLKFHQMTPK